MIDYKEIIEQLKDEDVFRLMERLGAQPIDKQDYILCKTVCHNIDADEASYKLYYYKNSHMFYCYTECGGMSIFKMLRNYYETRQIEYNWYTDIFQVVLNCSDDSVLNNVHPQAYKSQRDEYTTQKVRRVLPAHPPGILDVYTKYYPVEWLNDSITKETMKLLKSETAFESDEHIRKWLVRVAANESKSLWRSVWHRKVVSFSDLDVEPAYMDSEKGEMLTEVMRLPKKYSAVLHLHYYEAYTCSEIASILGISESNVQTRLMRARNMLKERLGEAWL